MAGADLGIVVLWHMHQPDYVDSWTQRARMPWVRLHALLSYHDMVRVLGEVPEAKAVFNVTPVLLRQLEEAGAGHVTDLFLEAARADPSGMSATDRASLLHDFFAFNHTRRFAELPRLAQLWQKRQEHGDPQAAAAFSDQEFRDLQVGFHLAWSGRTLREHGLVASLYRKGAGYTEADKHDLLDLQQEFLSGILPGWRQAAASGQMELSCTPDYHPILPLLCDSHAALESTPDLELPAGRWQRSGDAWWHVRSALDETERLLGIRPTGMWPAEGGLSERAIEVFATEPLAWLGGDQDVLTASLGDQTVPPGRHYQPFRWGPDTFPCLFFRDKPLSDRIGFVYASWTAQAAAADMVERLQAIRRELPPGRFLVPIALDGENPWEFYSDNGMPFVRCLYEAVAGAEGLAWTTFARFLSEGGASRAVRLHRLQAGSWIRNDLTTWIGHPEKNSGWDRLGTVRNWLQPKLEAAGAVRDVTLAGSGRCVRAPDPTCLGPCCDTPLARAWGAMAAAEGSDWFWWYGDDNETEFAEEFDQLFRDHLGNVYRHCDQEPDPVLRISLLTRAGSDRMRPPRFPLQVTVDGRITSEFEWLDAGVYELAGGAMRRDAPPVSRLWYGGSPGRLYLRLDPEPATGLAGLAGWQVTIHRCDGAAPPAALRLPGDCASAGVMEPVSEDGRCGPGGVSGACDQIVEMAVSWDRLAMAPGRTCEFYVTLGVAGRSEMVVPAAGGLKIRVPLGPGDADDRLI